MTVFWSGSAHKIQRLSGGANILVLNSGSSCIRFALFQAAEPMVRRCHGRLQRIPLGPPELIFEAPAATSARVVRFDPDDGRDLPQKLAGWLLGQEWFKTVDVVGHRLSQGLLHCATQFITPALLAELRRIVRFDPQQLAPELQLIDALRGVNPGLPQFACFDTAFHQHLPRSAKLLPIPRRYYEKGVRRNGSHGLSFAHVSDELRRLGEPALASGRIVYAHLGVGASVAAILNGVGIDTSTAFSPGAGMMMGTRSGDLDPGVITYLLRTEKMSVDQVHRMVDLESGMLGISESSADMVQLLELESRDERAAEAVDMFCAGARKWIAAMAAALGGLDVLVFTGGIGENSALIRGRIGDGLGFLGVGIDRARNLASEPVISPDLADVRVRVVRTDEESIIAGEVAGIIETGSTAET